jgi:transcriptional regulator GlxA family with amidase domain
MNIAIIDYPHSMQSAIHGCDEMFMLTNTFCREQAYDAHFEVDILQLDDILQDTFASKRYTAIFIPPGFKEECYLRPNSMLTHWLKQRHKEGSILCSACAGVFIIASTGLLHEREVTTHGILIDTLKTHYPSVQLKPHHILINDGDIITAGGMMSWVDLGLELVAQLTSPAIMRQLGRMLVVDTGRREQRYYQQFSPRYTHGDTAILEVQKQIRNDYKNSIKIADLAEQYCLTERTFLRRFVKATGIKPSEYIQRLRIQKVCDQLESTHHSFDYIANNVGYKDSGACRKAFVNIMGLTPQEFKNRFTGNGENMLAEVV